VTASAGIPASAELDRHPLEQLERWCAHITGPIASLGVLGMLVAAGFTVLDVLLRWLAGTAITALNEIIALAFAVAVAATIPSGVSQAVNLKIDIVARWFSGRVLAWLDAFGAALLALFFTVLAWEVWRYSAMLGSQDRTTVILSVPLAPFLLTAAFLIGLAAGLQALITANAVRKALAFRYAGEKPSPVSAIVVSLICLAITAMLVYVYVDFPGASAWARRNVDWTVLIAFVVMWSLMCLVVPLAAIMGLVGIVGSAVFIGWKPSLSAFATEATGFLTNSQIATLPMFLMMGSFAAVAGMADDIYRLAHACLSRFRGGLALATIGGCAGFGALTGSSIATAATIGRVALPEMRSRGYSPALASGCCAAGGTLGALVPPGSGPLVVFGLLTEASIGKLFVASIGPAILAVILYFLTVSAYVRVSPSSAPERSKPPPGEFASALKASIPIGLIFFVVMGGLFYGLFTDTESAAVGAFGAFAVAVARGKLNRAAFVSVMVETTATTAMIYGLIFGAQIISIFVSVSALIEAATAFMGSLHWAPVLIIAFMLLGYLVLGSIMEPFAVMVITVPIVTPLVVSMGYDIIWWGVIMLCVVETGMIHPPLGLNVFVLKSLQPDVPITMIYKGVIPFVAADLLKLALLVAFPAITLYLVSTMS
jgi:tripartite ATP-independent transporter DctM subunit